MPVARNRYSRPYGGPYKTGQPRPFSRQHGRGPATQEPILRPKVVAWTLVTLVLFVAALAALLWATIGPGGQSGDSTPAPVPRVTVTATPDVAGGAIEPTEGTEPITAPDEVAAELLLAESEPAVTVGMGVDLSEHSLDDPASPWVIVNKARPLTPQSWVPADLESVAGAQLVPQAATGLRAMVDDAGAADLELLVSTAYRSIGLQRSLYDGYAAQYGRDRADRFSARPGFSEHHTGWAVDVYASDACRLQECFADEDAGQWVAAHAHQYGFVVRYPDGAEEITGYRFEPWHLRFVGIELATAMHEHSILTLEEAFDLPPAPNYP